MASKQGRKQRHRARDILYTQAQSTGDIQKELQDTLRPFLGYGSGNEPVQTLVQGNELLQALYDIIPGILDPNQPMEMGLSAPGVLEGLIARSQEAISGQSRAGAQEYANLVPTRGGAAERGIADIYRSGAGEAANLETRLRAESAQQDLMNRLGLMEGVGGAMGSVGGSMGGIMELILGPYFADLQGQGMVNQLMSGIAEMDWSTAMQKKQHLAQVGKAFGGGLTEMAGSYLGQKTGGGSGSSKGGSKGGGGLTFLQGSGV